MAINYEDKRFQQVEQEKEAALDKNKNMYEGMINSSDKYFQDQINASKEWADKQTEIQTQQNQLIQDKLEQEKADSEKDYKKQQTGAYVDWQKQSNEYGTNAEKEAQMGMSGTGYSETTQANMYNAYQNRVALAHETYNKAVVQYDLAMKDAMLQNNSKLAEIAYNALQKQLELGLQGFQYKNTLLTQQAEKETQINNMYHQHYQDVLAQINHENALAEQQRQYNESLKLQREKLAEDKRQFEKSLAASRSSGGGGGGGGYSRGGYSGGGGGGIKKETYAVDHAYYRGDLNPDAKTYGTFKNGYQPKGIKGHGKVSSTGEKMVNWTTDRYGNNHKVIQTVWKTKDGKKWYWEGRQNKYLPFKK